jgi:NAD(P)-dependent dehydrogenase (short-subunit alcohol dehydrogenase family)
VIKQTYEKAEECLNTNYYGVKKVTEALLPLLQLSPAGARIVNVSSLRSELKVKATLPLPTYYLLRAYVTWDEKLITQPTYYSPPLEIALVLRVKLKT